MTRASQHHKSKPLWILMKQEMSNQTVCGPTLAAAAHGYRMDHNCVTLTIDLLTSGSMHAEPCHRVYVYQIWWG